MKHKILLLPLLIVLLLPIVAVRVTAQESAESEEAINLSQDSSVDEFTPESYDSDTAMQVGTVVQVDPSNSDKIIPATQDALSKAFAVVISRNRLQPLQIVDTTEQGRVYIATSGRHQALVTNENGTIQPGDFLVVSSLSGTLMKSSPKQEMVFAKALSGFDGSNNSVATTTLQDTEGRPHKQIGIGLIPISIQIIANPESEISTKANLPEQLQRLGQQIAEKEVSQIRIYLSMAIVTLSIIVALTVLYVGVRSSIIAIGRNPLSKKPILRGLLQVVLTSILVLIIGLFAVYLLLRL